MKKGLLVIFISLIFLGVWAVTKSHVRGEVMSENQVCEKWGNAKLDIAEFKKSEESRSKMACSLMKGQKQFYGKNAIEIRSLLGDFTGHYFSESYPTYLVQIAKIKGEDSWQLLFLIDSDRNVKQVVMHKNCCYK